MKSTADFWYSYLDLIQVIILLTNNWFKFPNFLNQYAVIESKLVAIQSSIENQD